MPEIINPNSDRDFVNTVNISDVKKYPLFFDKIKFEKFRHIEDLTVNFKNPISVISGTNKSGKTTILLSIACSHYHFKRRNLYNGILERSKWGDIMRFTKFDKQNEDWTYYVDYREGSKPHINKRGQRKNLTNKWNGVAKKESQIGTPTKSKLTGGRSVILIDLERILPGRGLSVSYFNKLKNTKLSSALTQIKKDYLSYVLELDYEVGSILKSADKEILEYTSNNTSYSSFNTASGEDVLSRIISDIVDAEKNSLILIEEIEIGLHPKIQRRLLDIIYHESKKNGKQFIITTHSPTVLSSVDSSSRIFIEKTNTVYKTINNISINAAFSKMDSLSYPLINLFLEDDISEKIVKKAIVKATLDLNLVSFKDLINIIISGSANNTFENFRVHKRTYSSKKLDSGYACILDGDMRKNFPLEDGLFFMYSDDAPELFLVKEYLKLYPHGNLNYHLKSNPHCLFMKMVEFNLCVDTNAAFELCWNSFMETEKGTNFLISLKDFLVDQCMFFSPEM